ncbi:hypothetical protein DFH08DRAFT_946670 [Mycena albidolilacea]|uniref:Ribonuclease H1 N-terminal domain-containing protein n=1 Tax=Mycena albidolilacea TaxID=1033008 RepID=A0AAD7ATJ6_9AGAR|nr:hypothetical protein DFH08DRAFT_946670 [Mycena albidolilacea]
MSTQQVPSTASQDPPSSELPRHRHWPRPQWMASWTDLELQQWRRIAPPTGAYDRAADLEMPPLVYNVPVDPNRGERLDTEAVRLALSLSARARTLQSDNESSDDEDIFASDDEHDGWRDPDHQLTMDDLYIGGARPADLTTTDDRAHHTCSVCLQVKSHPVIYCYVCILRATANIRLTFHCCDSCCEPRFFFRNGDPTEETISALARRKFYVVKKGARGSEGIYSGWDMAQPKVSGISDALYISCRTANEARQIWAQYCHDNHPQCRPPTYTPATPPRSPPPPVIIARSPPVLSPATPATPRRPARPPLLTAATPRTPSEFYRVAGSPRVLISAAAAEIEFREAGETASLLIGQSLSEVEDDDDDTPSGRRHFYRVLGSPRVRNNRDDALAELVATGANGLLVGRSLRDMVE